jgi:hypothetical protein
MSELKIKVIENCVSEQLVDFINAELQSERIVWCYTHNVTNRLRTNDKPGFSNSPFKEGMIINTAYWFLYPLLLEAANKNNFIVQKLLRIKLGAYVNRNSKKCNDVHRDSEEPHLVALYYPDDTDGDTVFFDNPKSKKEIFRVTPKKGTIVFFDGSIYHASTNPMKHDIRVTVNYNFLGEWPL